MSAAIRWTEDQLNSYQARRAGPTFAEIAAGTVFKPVKAEPAKQRSRIELAFIEAHTLAGLPPMAEEYRPLKGRRFRIDFAYPDRLIGVECDGAVHRIKDRFKRDQERKNLLLVAGWRLLYVGMEQIKSGQAIDWLRELLKGEI